MFEIATDCVMRLHAAGIGDCNRLCSETACRLHAVWHSVVRRVCVTQHGVVYSLVSKTALSFETYGLVQIKTTLKTIKLYSKREI